jgi:outer membrane lipopolysaccharide assembly protein LptE/RlpB
MRKIPAALAATALLATAACGQQPGAAPAAASRPPASCRQQYETWKHGPARHLEAAASRLQADGKAEDIPKLEADLKTAGRDAATLAPPPRCADPKDYEKQVMARISGLGGLMLAEVPLKNMKAIERKLGAELDKTVGKNR